ncbi:MAG: lycopene beta-cyclase CrtY [Janthinobacterium lividum]
MHRRRLDPGSRDFDLILVGGGLANGLIAWRLRQFRPSLRVLVLEAGDSLGGNHTWSFHETDLAPARRNWIAPLVAHRWPGHEVRFPGYSRRLEGDYCCIPSHRFHEVVHPSIQDSVRFGAHVEAVGPTQVTLADGTTLTAGAVIDGRGPKPSAHMRVGFQKFLGQEVRTRVPHGLRVPLLMDATVDQHGGYRFVYVLPLAPDVLLIEDTVYADGAAIDESELRRRVRTYATAQRWDIVELLREEHGVLPILLGGDVKAFWNATDGVPQAGVGAAFFHPTTGYSLPEAVAVADLVAARRDFDARSLHAALQTHATDRWKAGTFFRMLNRMLFLAAVPEQRRAVMERFYKFDEGLVARFYGGKLMWYDKLRLVTGRPPVPLIPALNAVLGGVS